MLLRKLSLVWLTIIGLLLPCFRPAAHGMAFIGIWGCFGSRPIPDTGSDFADIVLTPANRIRWDKVDVTFKFDASFDAAFRDARIKDQVRRAFQTWNTALALPRGASEFYLSMDRVQPFFDIRSITTHEVGHILGFHHPDQAATLGLNFTLSGTTLVSSPARGGEVMNSSIGNGDFNRILSWDELNAYRNSYGFQIIFREVSPNDFADIVLKAENMGDANILARGGPGAVRTDPFNPCGGGTPWIVWGPSITFNTAAASPLGLKTLGMNWDVVVAAQATESFQIRTRGTDNPPLERYNGEGHAYRFDSYTPAIAGVDFKDDLIHTWSVPTETATGTRRNVPAGTLFHVGVVMDVHNWINPMRGLARQTGRPDVSVPLLNMHEWGNALTTNGSRFKGNGSALTRIQNSRVTARGFVIQASDMDSMTHSLALANVNDMNLSLANLNRDTQILLSQSGRLMSIAPFGTRPLAANKKFYIVLEGGEADLPEAIRNQGNYLLLNRPDLIGKKLFVYLQSESAGVTVGNYALLGEKPVGNEPVEPVTAKVSGTLNMEGRSSTAAPQLITFNFRRVNYSGNEIRTISVGADGNFTIPNLPLDMYKLHIQGKRYLARNVDVDARFGNVLGVTATLQAGDANGDNAADIADLLEVISRYNTADSGAGDFNADGFIDIMDLLLLIRNYNRLGDM